MYIRLGTENHQLRIPRTQVLIQVYQLPNALLYTAFQCSTVLNRLHGDSVLCTVSKCRIINMATSKTMTKDSEHITHALYCSNVHVIYSIYWTSKLPLELKLYTDQHRRSIVYYWLIVGNMWKDLYFYFQSTCHQLMYWSQTVIKPKFQSVHYDHSYCMPYVPIVK